MLNAAIAYAKANGRTYSMAQAYSLHPDGTLAAHTVTSTRAYTEIDGLDDGRTMFAIASFEGVINFTAEGRLHYRICTGSSGTCRRAEWPLLHSLGALSEPVRAAISLRARGLDYSRGDRDRTECDRPGPAADRTHAKAGPPW
jgi:hypothetical protein